MSLTRFILLGGFLGAGKTTTIGRLARMYIDQGLRMGIVTNDQAADLVDTHALRMQGFAVGEVAGACFCCNFNELTQAADRLEKSDQPDVILAEPVGSCTDLVATVVQPLAKLYGNRFSIAPYAVILKPHHGRRILAEGARSGFSPKAEYIFRKQLEEADLILVNRVDELSPAEVDELCEQVARTTSAPVLRISAKTGHGFDALVEMLDQRGEFGRRILELDYDVYAEGEAELGWLNGSFQVTSDAEFSLDALLVDLVSRLRLALDVAGVETAHLKTIGLCDGCYGVANLTGRDAAAELSLPSHGRTRSAEMVVNARVATDPSNLQDEVLAAIASACTAIGARCESRGLQSFRPGRPVPTHRFAVAE